MQNSPESITKLFYFLSCTIKNDRKKSSQKNGIIESNIICGVCVLHELFLMGQTMKSLFLILKLWFYTISRVLLNKDLNKGTGSFTLWRKEKYKTFFLPYKFPLDWKFSRKLNVCHRDDLFFSSTHKLKSWGSEMKIWGDKTITKMNKMGFGWKNMKIFIQLELIGFFFFPDTKKLKIYITK